MPDACPTWGKKRTRPPTCNPCTKHIALIPTRELRTHPNTRRCLVPRSCLGDRVPPTSRPTGGQPAPQLLRRADSLLLPSSCAPRPFRASRLRRPSAEARSKRRSSRGGWLFATVSCVSHPAPKHNSLPRTRKAYRHRRSQRCVSGSEPSG